MAKKMGLTQVGSWIPTGNDSARLVGQLRQLVQLLTSAAGVASALSNVMAQVVTMHEGLQVSVNIAQVKEILRITRRFLSKYEDAEILGWVREAKGRKKSA